MTCTAQAWHKHSIPTGKDGVRQAYSRAAWMLAKALSLCLGCILHRHCGSFLLCDVCHLQLCHNTRLHKHCRCDIACHKIFSVSISVQALKQERVRRVLEGAPPSIVAETEEAVVGFFIEGCRFEMQSGHTERAIASIQAALEYACFAPSFPVGMLCS